MKLIAFITSTIESTVITSDLPWRRAPPITPGIGNDRNWMPCQASRAAARIWPASFVNQSRSQMSSATPMSTIISAAPSSPQMCIGCE